MKRIIGAVLLSFATVAAAGLLLTWLYQPQATGRGMVAFVGTRAAVVAAVVAGNVWAATRGASSRGAQVDKTRPSV